MPVTRVTDESSVIRSFALKPLDGSPALNYEAGQFLTVRATPNGLNKALVRTYTASSAPSDLAYRISVKREPGGVVSNHLHDTLKLGDIIEAKAPKGAFFIDANEARPAVLIAGGVGITPMISMARHVLHEGQRTRHMRPLTIFHSAQSTEQRDFAQEFRDLEQHSQGGIRYFSFVTNPTPKEKLGVDFDGIGYITADALQKALPLADNEFFLCGLPPFMQALYDTLRGLGVRDIRIFAESFGPASLTSTPDTGTAARPSPEEADEVVIAFATSGFEQPWSKGDATLLETAEAHGLSPIFSCRDGACGSCATRKLTGNVTYRTHPSADHTEDEVLICCAVPAKGTEILTLDL